MSPNENVLKDALAIYGRTGDSLEICRQKSATRPSRITWMTALIYLPTACTM